MLQLKNKITLNLIFVFSISDFFVYKFLNNFVN